MMQSLRSAAFWIGMLVFAIIAAPASSQVPQDTTFTGRLVDDLGDPLVGPVNMELRIFDMETLGTQLYSEQHLGTALDATGGFSVQLGLGTSPSGTFDAALFSDVNRWLEVVVGSDVLAPRQIMGSVPWALIAQQANKIVPDPNAPFEDCGDGTVADPQTGLVWEKKTGTVASVVVCETAGCPDPHDVNNLYEWSNTGSAPDGGAFTDFLEKLNDPFFGTAASVNEVTGCFAGHCDWRLPSITELLTILDCTQGVPCIDPIFGVTFGNVWSASTLTSDANSAWWVSFLNGGTPANPKTLDEFVRAVRPGTCH